MLGVLASNNNKQSGAQPEFCYGGRGLENGKFCDVFLLTK